MRGGSRRPVTAARRHGAAWLAGRAEIDPGRGGGSGAGSFHRRRALPARCAAPPGCWPRGLRRRAPQVLLPSPSSFCAGVERAIEVVERALDRYGPPVYGGRSSTTSTLSRPRVRGAVFVEELEQAGGARLVFSAHGVSPAVERGVARGQPVIDHLPARGQGPRGAALRRARLQRGADWPATTRRWGTTGEAPTSGSSTPEDVADLAVPTPGPHVTQTTLALDEVATWSSGLRDRFPNLVAAADDICYATQNRQDGGASWSPACHLLLVVGSDNSSNSKRLVEVAERDGVPAHLVDDETQIDPRGWPVGHCVGVTAGASAPSTSCSASSLALGGLGCAKPSTGGRRRESSFALPVEVRYHDAHPTAPEPSRSGSTC